MAGGKLSARQKMINLMYLVFIAMLALNMSKEVLSAFGFMKEEITRNTKSIEKRNEFSYANLAIKASDQPEKFALLNQKAVNVKAASNKLYSYFENLKAKMTADLEDKKDYESMDKTVFLDEYFFQGDKKTKEGQEFVNNINEYREAVITALGSDYNDLKDRVASRFDTNDVINEKISNKRPIDWLDARYKGFPLIASLTNITQLQSNIINTESEMLASILGGQLEADSKLTTNNYKGIVRLEKTAYFSGETVKGEVVLGRYDANLVPTEVELKVGGRNYKPTVKNGQVLLDFPSGNVGSKTIEGAITFMQDGVPTNIPYETEYQVIALPDSPVVSADKMNVVYRGLENPISISLPGVGDKDIKASAPGLKKVRPGKYILKPNAANTVKINVVANISGKSKTSSATFRIKDIPAAMGAVRGQYGVVGMPKSSLVRTTITAGLPDFEFDLKLKVNGFKVKVPGQVTILVRGNTFNAQAKKVLSKAKRGDVITIYDIDATVVNNSSYKLKKVLPVSIEVTN